MAGQHGAADLELTLHCLLQFTDRSRSIFPDKRRVRPHVPELRGDYPLRYVPPGFSELLFSFCPAGIVDIPIAHELIKPATVDAAAQAPGLLDEMPEQIPIETECLVVNESIKRLVHAEEQCGHIRSRGELLPLQLTGSLAGLPAL